MRLILVYILFIFISSCSLKNQDRFETKVHKTITGYGYTINLNGKVIIKQDYIPYVQDKISFCTTKDAQKIADIVKKKLIKNENPSISLIELEQQGITLNCLDLY